MKEYAVNEAALTEVQGDGASLRVHLHRLVESSGFIDPRLTVEVPPECEALWKAWLSISHSRIVGMGASGISFCEIEAWSRLHGVSLNSWELDTIIEVDRAFLSEKSKHKG